MTDTDRIAATTTIKTFIKEVNTIYNLDLPTEFPETTPLGKIWQTHVEVTQGDTDSILFTARGDPLDFVPFCIGITSFETRVTITLKKVIET